MTNLTGYGCTSGTYLYNINNLIVTAGSSPYTTECAPVNLPTIQANTWRIGYITAFGSSTNNASYCMRSSFGGIRWSNNASQQATYNYKQIPFQYMTGDTPFTPQYSYSSSVSSSFDLPAGYMNYVDLQKTNKILRPTTQQLGDSGMNSLVSVNGAVLDNRTVPANTLLHGKFTMWPNVNTTADTTLCCRVQDNNNFVIAGHSVNLKGGARQFAAVFSMGYFINNLFGSTPFTFKHVISQTSNATYNINWQTSYTYWTQS